MENPRRVQLAALPRSPRPHSLMLLATLMMGRGVGLFGWGWITFTMLFVLAFEVPQVLHHETMLRLEPTATSQGWLVGASSTSMSVNERPVVALHAEHHVAAELYHTTSYVQAPHPLLDQLQAQPRSPVTIVRCARDPHFAVIQGTRPTAAPPEAALIILLFLGVGVPFVAWGGVQGLRAYRVLRLGRVAFGRLVGQEATRVWVNKQPVVRYLFEFEASTGDRYIARAQTHAPQDIMDEAEEPILYDPSDPQRAHLLDDLPGRVDVSQGRFVYSRARALLALLAPTLPLGLMAWALWRAAP